MISTLDSGPFDVAQLRPFKLLPYAGNWTWYKVRIFERVSQSQSFEVISTFDSGPFDAERRSRRLDEPSRNGYNRGGWKLRSMWVQPPDHKRFEGCVSPLMTFRSSKHSFPLLFSRAFLHGRTIANSRAPLSRNS